MGGVGHVNHELNWSIIIFRKGDRLYSTRKKFLPTDCFSITLPTNPPTTKATTTSQNTVVFFMTHP